MARSQLLADPPAVQRTVQLFTVTYRPMDASAVWIGGLDKKHQALAMVLEDLVGSSAYSVELLDEMIAGYVGQIAVSETLAGQATQGETIGEFTVTGGLLLDLASWLEAEPRKLELSLSRENRRALQAGIDGADTWPVIQPELYPWATDGIYTLFMAVTHATLLERYAKAARVAKEHPGDGNDEALASVHA